MLHDVITLKNMGRVFKIPNTRALTSSVLVYLFVVSFSLVHAFTALLVAANFSGISAMYA